MISSPSAIIVDALWAETKSAFTSGSLDATGVLLLSAYVLSARTIVLGARTIPAGCIRNLPEKCA
jgi:hypothetical protein